MAPHLAHHVQREYDRVWVSAAGVYLENLSSKGSSAVPFTRSQAAAAVHESWSRTSDRSARTKPARDARLAKLEHQVDPDGLLSPVDRRTAAEHKRNTDLSVASQKAAARKARRKTG